MPLHIVQRGQNRGPCFNTTYRTGTLGDSRYKSSLIQAETYLLSCMRYIELNPLRAAMVDDPAHYRWTRYCANALENADTLLTPHPLYLGLGATGTTRHAIYRSLFRHHLEAEVIGDIRLAINQSQPLGNERFYARIERMRGQRRESKPRGRPRLEASTNDAPLPGQGKFGVVIERNASLAPVVHGSNLADLGCRIQPSRRVAIFRALAGLPVG